MSQGHRFAALAFASATLLAGCSSTSTTSTGTSTTSPPTTSATASTASIPKTTGTTQKTTGTTAAASSVQLKIVDTPYGKAIGQTDGKVVYAWDQEGPGKITCVQAACVEKWPPVTATTFTVGDGLDKARFSLVSRPDGTTQVALDGKALYTMAIDTPGEANCQGADGWWILNPDGSKNTTQSPATPPTTPPTSR